MSRTKLFCNLVVFTLICGNVIADTTEGNVLQASIQRPAVEDLIEKLVAAPTDQDKEKLLKENLGIVTPEIVRALLKRGEDARNQRNYAGALSIYKVALSAAKYLANDTLIGLSLADQAITINFTGDTDTAFKLLDEADGYAKRTGDKALITKVEGGRVETYLNNGALIDALEAAKREIAAAPAEMPLLQGDAYLHLGRTRAALALYQDAFPAFREAEIAYRRAGKTDKLYVVWNEQAIAHADSGRPDQSDQFYNQILELFGPLDEKNRLKRLNALSNKGLDQAYAEQSGEALKTLDEGIGLLRDGDPDVIRVTLYLNKSIALSKSRKPIEALDAVKKAYDDAQNSQQRAAKGPLNYIRLQWSRLLLSQESRSPDDVKRAVDLAEEAFKNTDPNNPEALWLAYTAEGNAYIAANRKTDALIALTKATEVIDAIVKNIGDDPEAIAAYLADKSDIYDGVASLLAQSDRARDALFALEKGRARGLLNVIRRGAPQPRQAMSTADREREAIARARLAEANQAMLAADQDPNATKSTKDELAAVLSRARTNWANLRLELTKNYPGVGRTSRQVTALSEEELKELMTDGDTAILEYILNAEDAVGLVITADSVGTPQVHSFNLRGGSKTVTANVARYQSIISTGQGGYTQLGKDLYNSLVAPAESYIQTKSRLIIVPSGQLWRVPFHALVHPDGQFLIQKYAVSYVQSLSVLRELRQKPRQTAQAKTELVALVNPTVSSNPKGASNTAVNRESVVLLGTILEPLPKIEAQATRFIEELGSKRGDLYPRDLATEEKFRTVATEAGAIYFAAHGIVNNEAPLYSRIVLASSGNNTSNDGVVEAWEVLEMKVPATLVILAACDSAGGQVKAGEGMIGLSWAFAVAGSPRLVASQWSVPESSTALLMDEMMRQIFGLSRDGRRIRRRAAPDVALQEAAKLLIANPETRDPWHWAGFEVIGDSRQ